MHWGQPRGEAGEEGTLEKKKKTEKTINRVLITKFIYHHKNNCHTIPCSLGNRIPSRTKHTVGASGLLIIVRYVLQREGEPRGAVLHGAGIRNGSAPGCRPNALENLTSRGPPKAAFLLPAVLSGGLLLGLGCTEWNAGGRYSLLALQPPQLALLPTDETESSSSPWPACRQKLLLHPAMPGGATEVTGASGGCLRKKLFPLAP